MRDDIVKEAVAGRTPTMTGWIRVECPFCVERTAKRDTRLSFGLNTETGGYHCFKCAIKGFLGGYENLDFDVKPKQETQEEIIPEGYEPFYTEKNKQNRLLEPYKDYAISRGLKPALWEKLQIGCCRDGKFFNRLIIPVLVDDKWVGWVGRSIYKSKMPYRNHAGAWKNSVMFNQDILKSEATFVFVVEGVLDAVHLWPNAVAVLGKPSQHHLMMLRNSNKKIIMLLDGDAWREGEANASRLRVLGCKAGSIKLPPKEDPDAFTKKELFSLVDMAVSQPESVWIER